MIAGSIVVYVGASRQPGCRIWQHPEKDCDRAMFLPVADDRLDELERHWIATLRPKYNKQHNPDARKPNREGRTLALWLRPDLFAALETWRKQQTVPPVRTTIVETALVRFLASQGIVVAPPDAD